jgi:hypothetical protein
MQTSRRSVGLVLMALLVAAMGGLYAFHVATGWPRKCLPVVSGGTSSVPHEGSAEPFLDWFGTCYPADP